MEQRITTHFYIDNYLFRDVYVGNSKREARKQFRKSIKQFKESLKGRKYV